MENSNYKFIKLPIVLALLMDNNCSQILNVLLSLSFIKSSNKFPVNSNYLQTITGLSKKVINATLSSLHRKGLITVECVGIGVSNTPNQITINTDKFEEYDKMNTSEILDCTSSRIVTDNYHQKGYKVSYLQDKEEEKEKISTGLPTNEENDFVTTVTSAETITDSDVDEIFKEVNVSVAPATATPPPVTKPETKEGWFDLLVASGYKIKDSEDPTSFVNVNFPLIERMCNENGLNQPELTYYDSENLYNYCLTKRYI